MGTPSKFGFPTPNPDELSLDQSRFADSQAKIRQKRDLKLTKSCIEHVSSSISMMFVRTHKKRATLADMIDQILFDNRSKRKALSFKAVQNILEDRYKVNVKILKKKIRNYINECLASGRFIQKSGRGANGSFRLSPSLRSRLHNQKRVFMRRSAMSLSRRQTRSQVSTDFM